MTTEPELDEEAVQAATAAREAALGPRLAAEWAHLAAALLAGRGPDWDAFRAAVWARLDDQPTDESANGYFEQLGNLALPRSHMALRLMGIWERAIQIVIEWERARSRRVHKGTGYYFAGLRDIAMGNVDRAFLYMHQAAAEDRHPAPAGVPTSPAGYFITMDARRYVGTAHEFIARYEAYLGQRLGAYIAAGRGVLDLEGFHARVAGDARLFDPVASLTHAVARILSIETARAAGALDNPFALSLRTQLALELCLVLEDLLQRLSPHRLALAGLIAQAAIPTVRLTTNDANVLNGLAATPAQFDSFVTELVDTGQVAGFDRPLAPREADLTLALVIRNKAAHGGERPAATHLRFDDVVTRLFNAIFVVIEVRYRP